MPFSTIEFHGERFQMRDSRLEGIIDLCSELSRQFIPTHKKPEQTGWLAEAVSDWREERILPPGCKWIQLDEWLTSTERCHIMANFLTFMTNHIQRNLPPTEAILANECQRVRDLILNATISTKPGNTNGDKNL